MSSLPLLLSSPSPSWRRPSFSWRRPSFSLSRSVGSRPLIGHSSARGPLVNSVQFWRPSSSETRLPFPQCVPKSGCGWSSRRLLVGVSFGLGGGADVSGGGTEPDASDDAVEARGQSTMPERFKHLAKEEPGEPFKWPWFIAVILMIYAWRTVAWELTNWKKAVVSLGQMLAYLMKLVLAAIFHFIGDPITGLVRFIETAFYFIRSFYAGVVAFAPIQELTSIIILTSIVLAISEATVENSINNQRHLLTIAGILGYLVVVGSVPAFLFWLVLLGLFCFSHFIKQKDGVSAALPAAAVAAAVGEPWVRGLVIALYGAVAIVQHWKSPKDNLEKQSNIKLPLPLLWVGLAIGIHLAAKWVRYRHLTWMIV